MFNASTGKQNCQPLCFGCSLLQPGALHYTATLMIISLRSPSEKLNCLFLILCVWFSSHSYASLPGETTSVFNHCKLPCRSEKLKASFRVMNLVKKKKHQNFQEECYTEMFLCIVRSTQSTMHVKCSACFFSSWDYGGMYDVEQRINSKRHINKGKVIGRMLKIFH